MAPGPACGDPTPPSPDYAELFEAAPTGYMLLDALGRIQRINRSGASLLGWESAWLVGKPFSRWVVNSDKQLFYAHQCKLRRGEDGSQELRIKNRHGRVVIVRLQSAHEVGCTEDAAGFRSTMIDVSGEQQSARELRRLQSQLAHLTRVNTVGELASSLAHELNQPLGTVVLNCDAALRLLQRGDADAYEFAEALNQARDAASFASDIIRHLRGFLRKSDELHKVCTLSDLIHDVSTLIAADANDSGMELRLNVEQHLPPVCVDAVQIEQVLLNLAHNGIEAMRGQDGAPGQLTISARRDMPERIRISVADTGPGLDAAQRARIFTPFYTTKHSGMGVGLSISRTIIEAHGGLLWASDEFGDGANLHFTLPVSEPARCAAGP